MTLDDARAAIAALFQKHNSGECTGDSELRAAVQRELRRRAHALLRTGERAGADQIDGSPAALYAALATDAAIPATEYPAFVMICARVMRCAVVGHMRGVGKRENVPGADLIVKIDEALDAVERVNSRLVRIVECLYFAGATEDDTARAMRIDVATLKREWVRARAWTRRQLAAAATSNAAIPNAPWIDAVFDDALAVPAERLNAILERCSSARGGLRAHVEELLSFAAAPKPRLEPGDLAAHFLLSTLTGLEPHDAIRVRGITIGSWRTVGEAAQQSDNACLQVERVDSPQAKGVLRFLPSSIARDVAALHARPDWRVLASLQHKGIARVLDAGEAGDGRVFIVSELVEGRPIDRYCDDEGLTIRQRLDLFERVCSSIQYAHRKIAVHGGLEAANVMVTPDGAVKLLDYGMAALLTASSVKDAETGLPALAIPAAYATPEHVRGEPLGVASDVYQLGLLLYLLLAGEPAQPFDAETDVGLESAVCSVVPQLPSARVRAGSRSASLRGFRQASLARTLRGDLDAIVLYALRKEPDRRYHSVSLLRSDIQRYVRRLPVWARGNTFAYRLRKFLSRRRAPLTAAAAILIFIAVAKAAAG